MRALVVGAGSVGRVYGYCLQRGGAQVSFLVRPPRAAELRSGFALYALNERGRTASRMTGFETLTSMPGVSRRTWDYVLLCVPSNALEDGWFRDLAGAIGDAALVSLLPGGDDRDWILERFSRERLVCGLISLVAYAAPLPGEDLPAPGTAYWFPPLSPGPFSGPPALVEPLVRALRAGGFPCGSHPDVARAAAAPGSILTGLVLALQASGWSFPRMRAGDGFVLAGRAAREEMGIARRKQGRGSPALACLVGPSFYRALLALAPRVVPFDLETYLRVHFTKVGVQVRQGLDKDIAHAARLGVPAEALRELRSRLRPA